MVKSDGLIYEKDHGIATLTLNRPNVHNALTPEMSRRWSRHS